MQLNRFRVWPALFLVPCLLAVGHAESMHHMDMGPAAVAPAAEPTFQQSYDVFTNFGNYMARIHCMRTAEGTPDWPWIGILAVLNITVMVGYLKIFRFWRQCYVSEAPADRNKKLMDLAGIFLFCSVCGYGFFIITLFWPAYRLLVVFMIALAIFTWRFAADLSEFRLSFSAKRLHRELQASLVRRNEELEELAARRTVELERANRFKGDFLANMSHELRTPMTAILGFADLLATPDVDRSEQTQYVETIRRNGQHLLGLVNDVLDLSKIEAGKLSVERVACDVGDQVRQVVSTFQPKADSLGVSLSAEIHADVPNVVLTDPLRLRQILTNLVGNALKFTERGSVRVAVEMEPRTNRTPLLKVKVKDTGRGIASHDLPGIFERFGQAGPGGRVAGVGSGLGLTISRNLARLLGGDIVAESTRDVGTTFTVTLDAGDPTQAVLAADRPTQKTGDRYALTGMRVLVAEDVADTQAYLHTLLARWGAITQVVDNGQSAVDQVLGSASGFDVILMDVQMPILDGLAATRQLRQGGFNGPIIALTANALIGDRGACLAAGCTEYASKPLDAARLLETIRRAMTANTPVVA